VFELILVVQLSIVGVLVHPDAVADPTLAQATQAICVTMTFLPTMAVLDFQPRHTRRRIVQQTSRTAVAEVSSGQAFQNEHAWRASVGENFGLAYLRFMMILFL